MSDESPPPSKKPAPAEAEVVEEALVKLPTGNPEAPTEVGEKQLAKVQETLPGEPAPEPALEGEPTVVDAPVAPVAPESPAAPVATSDLAPPVPSAPAGATPIAKTVVEPAPVIPKLDAPPTSKVEGKVERKRAVDEEPPSVRPLATRILKIALVALGSIALVAGILLVYITIRFDAVLKETVAAKAKDHGMKVQYDKIEATGILPWQSGKPKVTLKGVTLTSDEAPDVTVEVDTLEAPLKGGLLSYTCDHVEASGARINAPDIPSLVALEKAAKSGKASKTPTSIEDVTVRVSRVGKALPIGVVGKAKRIASHDGKVDLEGVTLEVPIPFANVKLGPVSAQLERADSMTWAKLENLDFARVGVQDDAKYAKLQADPVDSKTVGEKLGLDLPPMTISGEMAATLKGEEGMSGTFHLLLDGYVPPHPRELDGILHDKKTKVDGKLRYTDDVIFFDDMVVESGGLKLKGKGKLDWTKGGMIDLDLNGAVSCSALATSAIGSRLGSLAGVFTREVTSGHLEGSVNVAVKVSGKIQDFKKLSFAPTATIGCRISIL